MRWLAVLALTGCSLIGDPGHFPESFPHGGTGQFRYLEDDETGLNSPIQGRALAISHTALDGSMLVDGNLFYTGAALIDGAAMPPADFPPNEIFWDAFEARAIFHSAPREGDKGFGAGERVLGAEEAWEGSAVFDPWVVVDAGVVRMYYAGEGGIGVAESDSIDGRFTRAADAPILEGRRPSVIRGPDGAWWMYYDADGGIFVARSEDGIEFARMDGDANTAAIDPIVPAVAPANVEAAENAVESPEVSIANPGALGVTTTTGRHLVRIYYSSLREDGSIVLFVAGSEDGVTFERHPLPVVESPDARFAAPLMLDDRVTLLYFNVPFVSGDFQVRTLVASVSPAAVSFLPPEE